MPPYEAALLAVVAETHGVSVSQFMRAVLGSVTARVLEEHKAKGDLIMLLDIVRARLRRRNRGKQRQ